MFCHGLPERQVCHTVQVDAKPWCQGPLLLRISMPMLGRDMLVLSQPVAGEASLCRVPASLGTSRPYHLKLSSSRSPLPSRHYNRVLSSPALKLTGGTALPRPYPSWPPRINLLVFAWLSLCPDILLRGLTDGWLKMLENLDPA